MASKGSGRRYWVVSPNVQDKEPTVSKWRAATVEGRAAFMGYPPNDKDHHASGYKFAHEVRSTHVILIARRHRSSPEIVGFSIVRGNFQTSLKGVRLPSKPGAVRRLVPFIPLSRVPYG